MIYSSDYRDVGIDNGLPLTNNPIELYKEIKNMQISTRLNEFIIESNYIEGITEFDIERQLFTYQWFFDLDKITILNLQDFAIQLYNTSNDPNGRKPELRDKTGMNVYIGSHCPLKGGFDVVRQLTYILNRANKAKLRDIYKVHCKYELLHPFMDCNGRTGRALWAWMMNKNGYTFSNGFLRQWYYQSLDQYRDDKA